MQDDFPSNKHYGFYVEHPEIPEKVKVEYNGQWSKVSPDVIHFQLYSVWTSSSGYRSHFTFKPLLEEFNNSVHDAAKALVDELYRERKKSLSKQEVNELKYGQQQSLF